MASDALSSSDSSGSESEFEKEESATSILDTAGKPQLTVKAVAGGIVAGCCGSFLAVYYGLKTGVTPSLNIISALLGFAAVRLIQKSGISKGDYTPQETCVIQTMAVACTEVASASGFSSGLLGMTREAAELTKIPGSSLTDVVDLPLGKTMLWSSSIAFFGLFIAFPLRNYCIIERKLLFPSGTATATVIRTLHADPSHVRKSLKLLALFAGITWAWSMFLWTFQGLGEFPLFGMAAAKYGWQMDWDLSQFAIGMLLGPNINLSILLGGFLGSGLLGPWVQGSHECEASLKGAGNPSCWYYSDAPKYLDMKAYTLFPGIAMVVVDGFYSIVKLVFIVIKGFTKPNSYSNAGAAEEGVDDLTTQRELIRIFTGARIPPWAYIGGYFVAITFCICMVTWLFGVVWWQVLMANLLTPIFAVGIIIGMGMTDWNVSSSFGKLMMFPLGMLNHGGSVIPSLAVCMITISGCGNAAALMQDFKTGYLVGASPRTSLHVLQGPKIAPPRQQHQAHSTSSGVHFRSPTMIRTPSSTVCMVRSIGHWRLSPRPTAWARCPRIASPSCWGLRSWPWASTAEATSPRRPARAASPSCRAPWGSAWGC